MYSWKSDAVRGSGKREAFSIGIYLSQAKTLEDIYVVLKAGEASAPVLWESRRICGAFMMGGKPFLVKFK